MYVVIDSFFYYYQLIILNYQLPKVWLNIFGDFGFPAAQNHFHHKLINLLHIFWRKSKTF